MSSALIQSLNDSYPSLKKQCKGAYFFFKEEGYCTIINGDATEASEILGVPLRYNDGIPFIQFPAESIDTNLCTLVKKGNRVAIIEPLK